MLGLDRKQIIILAGVGIILFSIPLGIYLGSKTQIFKSRASELKPQSQIGQKIASKSATTVKPVPNSSPLSQIQQLLGSEASRATSSAANSFSSKTTVTTPTPTPASLNISFGPTLTVRVKIQGRPANNQSGKVFIGIGSGQPAANPKYLLNFTVDFPSSGVFTELSLAGLNPGSTYTAYVKGSGQLTKTATFVMSPTVSILNNDQPLELLSGDLNDDNVINSADYAIAKALYGTTTGDTKWDQRADFNLDNIINTLDLAIITTNLGKTGDSGVWQSTPIASGSAQVNINLAPVTKAQGGFESLRFSEPSPTLDTLTQGNLWLKIP